MSKIQEARVSAVAGAVGGLVTQAQQRATHGVDLAFAASRLAPSRFDRYTPQLSCYRTVSQRSLSVPTTFMSAEYRPAEGWGGSLASHFYELLSSPTYGAVQPDAGRDTTRFFDANRQTERARIAGMVLIGMRVKIGVKLWWGGSGPYVEVDDVSAGELPNQLADLVRDNLRIAIYHTADDLSNTGAIVALPPNAAAQKAEPWVDWTPLRYFDRADGEFVPVPPLLWPTRNRDPNMQITPYPAEFAVSAADNASYNNEPLPFFGSVAPATPPAQIAFFTSRLVIVVEALFVPSPEDCGKYWPGVLCPTHKIGLHPHYDRSVPVLRKAMAGSVPKRQCRGCGCKAPKRPQLREEIESTKLGLLDPRFNVREAVKQMLLLEHHLVEANKHCPDCIQKHCLAIEAYGEEGVSLDRDGTDAAVVCERIASTVRELERRLQAGEDKRNVARDLRTHRKQVTKWLRQKLKTQE
jgi:hypothetical protein